MKAQGKTKRYLLDIRKRIGNRNYVEGCKDCKSNRLTVKEQAELVRVALRLYQHIESGACLALAAGLADRKRANELNREIRQQLIATARREFGE